MRSIAVFGALFVLASTTAHAWRKVVASRGKTKNGVLLQTFYLIDPDKGIYKLTAVNGFNDHQVKMPCEKVLGDGSILVRNFDGQLLRLSRNQVKSYGSYFHKGPGLLLRMPLTAAGTTDILYETSFDQPPPRRAKVIGLVDKKVDDQLEIRTEEGTRYRVELVDPVRYYEIAEQMRRTDPKLGTILFWKPQGRKSAAKGPNERSERSKKL